MTSLAAQPSADAGSGLDPVKMQLKWTHQFQFAGYYAAIAQGYYRAAGLDVELIEAQPGPDPVEPVLEGKADFGVGTSNLMLIRAQGKPVVVLAVIYQHSPLLLLARADTGIKDIHDLVGKPMMIEPQSADIYAYFTNEDINVARLNLRPHTFNVNDLIQGHVMAMSAYATDEPFKLRSVGITPLEFSPREGGIDFYGDNLFTTQQEIDQHPERVRAFRAASLRGWSYALAHQDEMIDLIEKQYNRGHTREQLTFEAKETERLMHPDLIEVGYMNPGRWRHIEETYQQLGMLPATFSLKGFTYDANPHPNLQMLYGALIVLALLAAGALFWLFPLLYLNGKLRHEIRQRIVAQNELIAAKERTEEAHAAQSRFLAVMSHEIRAPIGGISRLLSLILEDEKDLRPDLKHDLSMLQKSAQSLYSLVDELLEWSRIEAGGVELETSPIEVKSFLEDIQRLFLPAAEIKKLALRCEIDPGMPEMIFSDALRLRQIISNLLANAIKFTESGSVTVTARRKPPGDQASGSRFLFSVQDTGIGIPAQALGRLFKPYQQADASIARKFGGSGLGLSISINLAQLLGGTITVASDPGRGSCFEVEIVAREQAATIQPDPMPEQSTDSS